MIPTIVGADNEQNSNVLHVAGLSPTTNDKHLASCLV